MENMNLSEIEARLAEIDALVEAATAPIDGIEDEKRALLERKAELAEIEQRKKDAEALEQREVAPEKIIEIKEEVRTMFDVKSPEYRDAFVANLLGRATPEQRGFFADNSAYGDGYALPQVLDQAIWDQVTLQHPILADVTTIRSGVVMKVTKVTPTVPAKKKDSDASTEMANSTVEVLLAGADYHTYVTLSYAEAKMSQGAFEKFLVKEVADALGESLAKDVFARILTDAGSAAATYTSGTNTYFECLATALGAATHAQNAVAYAPANIYYAVLGEQDNNGQPIFRDGLLLGVPFKKDSAATKLTIVDPNQFVLNVIQDTMVESQRDAKNAQIVIGGFLRAEGCMRNTKACAYVA